MQLPAVRIARALGWEVSVLALAISEPIRELSHRCLQVDLSDVQAVEAAARRLAEGPGLDGVFTAGTDFSTSVAWVAERLGLPGIPYGAALDATDKARMRARFQEHGVPSPRFTVLEPGGPPLRAAALPGDLEFPVVVKPVDNMGARGVRRADTEGELRAALDTAWAQSRSRRAIVEEFLEGPELSLDAVVWDGRVTICGVADRHIVFPPYFVEIGHTLPSALPKEVLRQAEEVFVRGILALGLRTGAAKGDIKLTPRGVMVGEIAARLSGGYMSGWTCPLATGVEVTEAALRLAVGLPPGDLTPMRARVAAERAFISIPGRIQSISGIGEAAAMQGVHEVFLRVHEGQEAELPINNMGKCGNVIAAAGTYQEAVAAARAAVQGILVRLVPGEGHTEDFLSGRVQRGFSAFPAPSAALEQALRRMPAKAGEADGANPAVRILVPPEVEGEQNRDWHGFSLGEALRAVCRVTGAEAIAGDREPGPGAVALGAPFWRGLLKGGVQAGVYLIDTLRTDRSGLGSAWSHLTRSA